VAAARPIGKNDWLIALGLATFGFSVRLFWALRPRAVHWDEPDYLLLARNLLRGQGYQILGLPETHLPPIAPWLATASLALGAPVDLAMSLWHALAGAIFCGLIFLIALEISGNRPAALWTGWLATIASPLVVRPLYWGSMTESVFLLLLWLGLWAVWRLLHGGSWRAGLAAGAALALSYLTRPEGLLWWALFAVIALVLVIWRRDDRQKAWPGTVLYLLVFLLLSGSYWLYLYRSTGQLLLSGKTGITLLQAEGANKDLSVVLDSSGQEVLWLSPERYQVGVASVVEADPLGALKRLSANLRNLPGVVLAALVPLHLIVLIGLGLWVQPWGRRRLIEQAFWLACLLPLLIVPLTHLLPRLLLPLLPVALVWAGQGVQRLVEWARGTASPWPRLARPLAWLWPLLLALLMAALAANSQFDDERAGQATITPGHRQAAFWLAANSHPDQAVMTRNSEIALYADRLLAPLPNADLDQVLGYARRHGAGFLAVDDIELRLLRPQFAHIAEPGQTPSTLELAATFPGPMRTTYLFRIH
jgi:4-amino-4-deoxy-L-arabinose transferase-like glycosyltransferase